MLILIAQTIDLATPPVNSPAMLKHGNNPQVLQVRKKLIKRISALHMEVRWPFVCSVIASLDRQVHILEGRLSRVSLVVGWQATATHTDAPENTDEHLPGLDDGHECGYESGADSPDHGEHHPEDEVACTKTPFSEDSYPLSLEVASLWYSAVQCCTCCRRSSRGIREGF